MKRLSWLLGAVCAFAIVPSAHADSAEGLKITPLTYQQSVPLGHTQKGFVDISNPSTADVHIQTEAQAFRQIDSDGNLAFYTDPRITAGIVPELKDFTLGPRQAVRMYFTVDANKLGEGGVYAGLFAHTVAPPNTESGAHVQVETRVGTLLILDVGGKGTKDGLIASLKGTRLALGRSLKGKITYRNVGSDEHSVAYNPKFRVTVGPLTHRQTINGPLVLPSSNRTIMFERKGSYIGFIPLTVHDTTSQTRGRTLWVFAITGWWRFGLPLLLVALALVVHYWRWLEAHLQTTQKSRH